LLAPLHDGETATCVAAERGVLVALAGDCKTPMAAHALRSGPHLHLRAFVANPDGSGRRDAERKVPWPASEADARDVGLEVGRELA
jgi:hydroxymethylbilane synthase